VPKCSLCKGRGWSVIEGFQFRIDKCEKCNGTGKTIAKILLEGEEAQKWLEKTYKTTREEYNKQRNIFNRIFDFLKYLPNAIKRHWEES